MQSPAVGVTIVIRLEGWTVPTVSFSFLLLSVSEILVMSTSLVSGEISLWLPHYAEL